MPSFLLRITHILNSYTQCSRVSRKKKFIAEKKKRKLYIRGKGFRKYTPVICKRKKKEDKYGCVYICVLYERKENVFFFYLLLCRSVPLTPSSSPPLCERNVITKSLKFLHDRNFFGLRKTNLDFFTRLFFFLWMQKGNVLYPPFLFFFFRLGIFI